MYAYAGNNPVRYTDPDGQFAETAWDILSLATGVASFVSNVREGNVTGAIIDGLGIVADTAAVALPFIPGGASAAIKTVRAVGASADIVSGIITSADGIATGEPLEVVSGLLQATGGISRLDDSLSLIKDTGGLSQKKVHGNSLDTTKPAQGYVLRDKNTNEILKYGETTMGEKRYTKKYLNENNAKIEFQASGTKREMHYWQNEKILEYKNTHNGQRPLLNKSDW